MIATFGRVTALGIKVESPQPVIGRGLETESPTARVYKVPERYYTKR